MKAREFLFAVTRPRIQPLDEVGFRTNVGRIPSGVTSRDRGMVLSRYMTYADSLTPYTRSKKYYHATVRILTGERKGHTFCLQQGQYYKI